MNSSSYKKHKDGENCDYQNDNSETPCWGEVERFSDCHFEDYYFVHVCKGHAGMMSEGEYKKEITN